MKKIISPCVYEVETGRGKKQVNVYVRIEYDGHCLSISGEIGTGRNMIAGGQCIEEVRQGIPKDGWTNEMIQQLCDIWEAWHLNDMRPYCSHMKELGWHKQATEKIRIEHHNLTREAIKRKKAAENRALESLRAGQSFVPTKEEIIYANLPYSLDMYNGENLLDKYGKLYQDAYELKGKDCLGHPNVTEELRGWISYKDHPTGFIGRPCPVCGYEYGTGWKTEEVPQDVLKWLEALPEASNRHAY